MCKWLRIKFPHFRIMLTSEKSKQQYQTAKLILLNSYDVSDTKERSMKTLCLGWAFNRKFWPGRGNLNEPIFKSSMLGVSGEM